MDNYQTCLRRCMGLGAVSAIAAALSLADGSAVAQEANPELKKFQGDWEVVELVENGTVIATDRIREILPSGGRVRIIENAIIFRSPKDQKQHAKTFSIEPTKYPRSINIGDSEGKTSRGIYQFDQEKLVVCVGDPDSDIRPGEFSAGADSHRMLMVLKKSSESAKPALHSSRQPDTARSEIKAPATLKSSTALKGLSDADITKRIVGTWVLKDNAGSLYITFRTDGTFNTVREYQELRLFHKSFVQTPISNGSWSVRGGQLSTFVGASVEARKVNRLFGFDVRSISDKDMIFVDQLGRVVRATRVGSLR